MTVVRTPTGWRLTGPPPTIRALARPEEALRRLAAAILAEDEATLLEVLPDSARRAIEARGGEALVTALGRSAVWRALAEVLGGPEEVVVPGEGSARQVTVRVPGGPVTVVWLGREDLRWKVFDVTPRSDYTLPDALR